MSERTIITDRTAELHKRIWEDRGKLCGCIAEPQFPRAMDGPPLSEVIPLIPRKEWPDRIRARSASQLSHLIEVAGLPCYDQGGTNYCWAHAATLALNAAEIVSGLPMVELAPESVAVPITGGRNRGGTLTEALDYLRAFGAAERRFIPRNELRQSRFADGWKANRALHRIDEYHPIVGPKIWDQMITGVLDGFALMKGLRWWEHAVADTDVVLDDDDTVLVKFRNSYGAEYGENGFAYLDESRGTPEPGWGIIAVRSTIVSGPLEC